MRLPGVLDIPPQQNNTNSEAIVIIPGWGEGLWGWRKPAQAIAEVTKRRVIVIAAPSWREFRFQPGVASSLNRLANHVCEVLERLKVRKAIGIGHSMGGYCLALASSQKPELFSQLEFICPSGLMENDKLLHLACRLGKKVGLSLPYALFHRQILASTLIAQAEGLWYIARNPYAIREAIEVAGVAIENLVSIGIPARVILAQDDAIYPAHRQIVPNHWPSHTVEGQHDLQYDSQGFALLIQELLL